MYIKILIALIAYGIYRFVTKNLNHWKKLKLPGPEPLPFFGNFKDVALRRKQISVVFQEIYNAYPNEKVVGVYRMTMPNLLIRDLEIIKHIMIKDFDNFVERGSEFGENGLGKNMFNARAESWRILRGHFSPLFTSGKLKNMFHLMTDCGDKLTDHIEDLIRQNPEQDLYDVVKMFTVSTISACAFGLDVDVDQLAVLEVINSKLFKLSYLFDLTFLIPGILKMLKIAPLPSLFTNFFRSLVKTVLEQRNGQPTNRKDFMDLIMEMKQNGTTLYGRKRVGDEKPMSMELSEDLIAAQAFIFYVAGFETSATTMTFMLYELMKHPEIQEKIFEEIDRVLVKHNGQVTYEAINEMPYLDMVFQETLRMYPLVDPLLRKAREDYVLPGTNITVKKGEVVLIPARGIQRDPKYYPNPDTFDPERFSPDKEDNPCTFLAFGIGPRNCIGMRFAKVQSRVCLVKILTKFRIERSKNTKPIMELDPKRGLAGSKETIYGNIVPRNNN